MSAQRSQLMEEDARVSSLRPVLEGHRAPAARRRPSVLEGRSGRALSLLLDVAMAALATLLAWSGSVPPESSAVFIASPVLIVALLAVRGGYEQRLSPNVLGGLAKVAAAVSVACMAIVCVLVLAGDPQAGLPDLLVRLWAASLLLVGVGRIGFHLLRRRARARYATGRRTLIVGAGQVGQDIARRLLDAPAYGLVPVGFLDADPPAFAGRASLPPVLGSAERLAEVARAVGAEQVILAFSKTPDVRLVDLSRTCAELGLGMAIVPRYFEALNDRVGVERVGPLPLLDLRQVDPKGWQFTLKYALDRCIAAVALVGFAPLMLVIAIAVRLSSPGPLLFRQERVGLDGHRFDMLKFRTMRSSPQAAGEADAAWAAAVLHPGTAAPEPAAVAVTDLEDRRTKVGTLLRKTSLDELPQLFNILRGDMSIVGPRPERTHYVEQFEGAIRRYPDRHRVKAGLTGLAQVNGLRGQTSLQQRIVWDNHYIHNWSFLLDVKILVLTFAAVLRHQES